MALAERIMAANAFLGRIAEDGGGYRIADIGLIHAAGPDRILGLTAIVRLEHAVDGIYELPVTCHGVSGPPFALPPTTFNFDRVSHLIVDVSFADRRIAEHLAPQRKLATGARRRLPVRPEHLRAPRPARHRLLTPEGSRSRRYSGCSGTFAGVRRGIQPGTAARYASYSAPYSARRVGSS